MSTATCIWSGTISVSPSRLRYTHLGREARVLLNEQLDVDLPNLRRPQLLADGENRLHLAWLSRQEGVQRLYHTLRWPGWSNRRLEALFR